MYSDEDLEFIKNKYIEELDYPDDLNSHVLSCIANSYVDKNLEKSYKKNNSGFKYFLVACVSLIIVVVFKNQIFNVDNPQIDHNYNMSTRSIDIYDGFVYEENFTHGFFENDFIMSIYPQKQIIGIEDMVYNIDKINDRILYLKDVLVDNIHEADIDEFLKNILKDEKSKFYIDSNGVYNVIFYDDNNIGNIIDIDEYLISKIFKEEYIV